ncbi:MAG TPA: DUF1569 domain-containing protein [Longimicrobiaceae bacterium]
MKSLFDERARAGMLDRVARLTPGHHGLWGRMNAGQMLVHTADQLRMALGDLPCRPLPTPLRYPVLKQLVVYWLPWPKGTPTAPELRPRPFEGDWEAARASLRAQVGRFAGRTPRDAWPEHPAFGRLSGRAWGVLSWRHLDHHLRQFGV